MAAAKRNTYLVCYDVADPRRLYKVHKFLLGYRVGGQKSCFECWLTPAELRDVRSGLYERLVLDEDRAHIFQLDPDKDNICLGAANPLPRGPFLIM